MAYIKPTAGLGGLVAVLALLSGAATAQNTDDRVFRGGAEAPSRAVERGVTVVRGLVAVSPAAAPAVRVVSGRSLWLVDEAGGRLTACELQETGLAGRQAIECAARDLPDLGRD